MDRAVAYLRTSPGTNDDGTSIPGQRRDIQGWADEHDVDIVAWFEDEGVSGQKTAPLERDGFAELKEFVFRENVQTIVARRTHRFGRQVKDLMALRELFRWLYEERFREQQTFRFVDVEGDDLDYEIDRDSDTDPVEQFSEMIPELFSVLLGTMKAAETSRDTSTALQGKKSRDEPVGRPPFGLTTDKAKRDDQDTATEYLPGDRFETAIAVLSEFDEAVGRTPDTDDGPSAWAAGRDHGVSSPSKTVKSMWERRDLYRRVAQDHRPDLDPDW